MKYADVVMDFMQKVVIASGRDVGDYLVARGFYGEKNNSGWNNANKILNYLVSLGKLERGDGFYRLPGCLSQHKEHSRHLTKALVQVIKVFPDAQIIREKEVSAVSMVPDAIVLITKDEKGLCLILEAVNNEFPEYLQSKVDVWNTWDGALEYLSSVFGYRVPHFEIVAYPESPIKEVWNFQDFIQEAQQ